MTKYRSSQQLHEPTLSNVSPVFPVYILPQVETESALRNKALTAVSEW
jgi:hypothetical protein